MYKCKYFDIEELVSKETLDSIGETESWKLIDEKLLEVIDFIREGVGPLFANTWKEGGEFSYRGYRPKSYKGGAPKSQHRLGKALDMHSKKYTAEELRKWIKENKENLPHNIRVESGVNWLHVDVHSDNKEKLYFFKP